MTLGPLQCPDCHGVRGPIPCASCGGTGQLSRVDDDFDPTVEAEHSSTPAPVPADDVEWQRWAKSKLDDHERHGL